MAIVPYQRGENQARTILDHIMLYEIWAEIKQNLHGIAVGGF